ncbi:MAG: cobalamin-independent methionine synthase II family protein [Xanthobacteraceae bacterium]
MRRSETSIKTTHSGRLPPVGTGSPPSTNAADGAALVGQVAEVIRKQARLGIDCVGDGEFWNGRTFQYYAQQFNGITMRPLRPGERGSGRESTRERDTFAKLYADMDRVGTVFCVPGEEARWFPSLTKAVATGPIKGRATDAIRREISVFKEALKAAGGDHEAFICVYAPGWLDHFIYNEHYATDEEFVFALADAVSGEYRAVVDAGFILQIDDPGVVTSWDMIKPAPTFAEYRKYLKLRIDALNHALAGIPEDRVRHHFCWGSWHGAHTHDLPVKEIIDLVLEIRAQAYSFEAGNVRHEHEWTIWKDVKLPAGKIIVPGVISHATNIVEHPELIARRIRSFAEAVGRENVIASTDCGLGTRLHEELVWAKLSALVEGARLASKALWAR